MLIPDKFYRYYNTDYTPPIDLVILGLEDNNFKVILSNYNVDLNEYRNWSYKIGEVHCYGQEMLAKDILSGRLKRMEDET